MHKQIVAFSLAILGLAVSCDNALLDKVKKTQQVAQSSKIVVYLGEAAVESGGVVLFPNTMVGRSSSVTLTIVNEGAAALAIGTVGAAALSGEGAGLFAVAAQPDATVGVGESTSLELQFSPQEAATRPATLTFATNDVSAERFVLRLEGLGLVGYPVVLTLEVESTGQNTAVARGRVDNAGGVTLKTMGACWRLDVAEPEVGGADVSKGEKTGALGEYDIEMTGLVLGRTYYVRAFAENSLLRGYGEDIEFVAGNCRVDFDTDGGTAIASQDVQYDGTVTEPGTPPTKTGHSFAGWFVDESCATAWDFDTHTVTGNTTIYAKWTVNSYTISFAANGGSGSMSPMTVDYGETVQLTANTFTRDGWLFDGWNSADNGSGTAYADGASYTMGDGDVTLYAVWIDYTRGLAFTLIDGGAHYSVASGSVTSGPVQVCAAYSGKPVTAVAANAFSGLSGLTALSLPASVVFIGASAFNGCDGLASLTIPAAVTSIGSAAFQDCANLTSLTIPDGVGTIPANAFSGCAGLTSVTLPSGILTIGASAFAYCEQLSSLTLPSGLTTIEANAFQGCSGLTSLAIPDGIEAIPSYAFDHCSSLASLTIPEDLQTLGTYAFSYCTSLTSITIPSGVADIPLRAFDHCTSLESLTLPAGLSTIGNNAFDHCSSLAAISIPSAVTAIGGYAFTYCSALTSIDIPDGVTAIANGLLLGCSSLTSVGLPATASSFGTSVFYGCSALTTVTLPSGIPSIGANAFQNCGELTSLTIPASVTAIGNYAFAGCNKLAAPSLPSGLATIGNYAFEYCDAIVSLDIPSAVTSIGDYAFMDCDGLTTVTVLRYDEENDYPITSAGTAIFAYCDNLAIDGAMYIHVPAGSLVAYEEDSYWSLYVVQIVTP